MWLRTTCSMSFEIDVPTPFIFMLRPRSGGQQRAAREEYTLTPDCPMEEFTDNFGNLCQRLLGQPGPFSITTSAEVKTVDTIEQAPGAPFIEVQYLPDSMLCYLLPSRYCESDRFVQMANEITADQQPGYDQVSAIQRWLRERIRYEPMLGNDQLSAAEVNMRQWGVCRDFAHLGIAGVSVFPPEWSSATSTSLTLSICMPGLRPMWVASGTPLMRHNQHCGVVMWQSAMAGTPPMWLFTTSLVRLSRRSRNG